ncbi:MAG: WYL domain-containing protein [Bulleidia sp.]|nr:WYL domain-containing protein [Bulleidia sp.]
MENNKKIIPWYILNILQENTDEEHPVSEPAIRDLCERKHGVTFERRTLYSSVSMLKDLGYDIEYTNTGSSQGYYLADKSRTFTEPEVLLLCNAVHASHFISESQSKALMKKLLSSQNKYFRKSFKDSVYLPNPLKTANNQLLQNIRIISEAIRTKHVIHFHYLAYGFDGRQHPKDKEYTVEPRYIVYHGSRGYMLVTQTTHEGLIKYRLDRMADVTIGEETVTELSEEDNTDAYALSRNEMFMFSGTPVKATLHCQDRILDTMLDTFGPSAHILRHEDGFFDLSITSPAQNILLFAQQYMDVITITEPADLKKQMQDMLKETLERYLGS